MDYLPTIGLEIHAELKTRTKMFCSSKNDPEELRPNVNICPICLAHPGTLPVINREAVRHVLRVGVALGGSLADGTEFDRKNYFYPDLPKGYQISQYEHPLVRGGILAGVPITRVHLEEDTASSMHDDANGTTAIDYNRAGIPLMELVTEPAISSAENAGAFARELQLLLRYLGASDADMEKGQMRVEANISLREIADERRETADMREGDNLRQSAESQRESATLGTKVEIKNLNSFRAMERAVAYEIERQKKLLSEGGTVIQETRGWNEKSQTTYSQRIKEESADYRYFPDPDLPSLTLSELPDMRADALRSELPELPEARKRRYMTRGLKEEDAGMFVRERPLGAFFDDVVAGRDAAGVQLSANYIANDLMNLVRTGEERMNRDAEKRDTQIHHEIPISAGHFREIIDMLLKKEISSRAAKDLLQLSAADKKSPRELAEARGLKQGKDAGALTELVKKVVAANPNVAADYAAGKEAALGFLVGAVMKELRGAGDPTLIRDSLKKAISAARE